MLAFLAKIKHAVSSRKLSDVNVKPVLRSAAFLVIISYLFFQLSQIGFRDIASALPRSLWFYVLSIGFVAAPVIAEILAFKTITGRKVGGDFRLFLRKHVLNKAVMNFSGDAFLMQKLSKYEGLNLRSAAIILKDMTLIRAVSANFWIVLLAIAVVLSGNFEVLQALTASAPWVAVFTAVFCVGICSAAVLLFRKLTRLSSKTALKVAAIYLTRAAIVGAILMTQWSIASPGTAMGAWFIFLIVFSVAKKSPVGGELLFASIVVTLPSLGGDDAAIAAMLIAIAAVTQVIYFLGFLLSFERSKTPAIKSAPVLLPA